MRITGPPVRPRTAFTTDVLAYTRWLLRGGRPGSPEVAVAELAGGRAGTARDDRGGGVLALD